MRKLLTLAGVVVFAWSASPAHARPPTEADALAISQGLVGDLQKEPPGPPGLHFLFGYGVLDAEFQAGPGGSQEFLHSVRGGDSAIWSGHYLAAEAYRYAVTRTDEAKRSVLAAYQAIEDLVNVTGQDLLARTIIPRDDPRAARVLNEEKRSGVWEATLRGEPVYYIGRTSRDQYTGAFLGLSVTYSVVDDDALRARISQLVVRMIEKLERSGWHVGFDESGAVHKPDPSFVTYLTHWFQIAAVLQVGKQVAPGRFQPLRLPVSFWLHMVYEGLNPYGAYYKFNLAYAHLFNLIRLEKSAFWRWEFGWAYSHLRANTRKHGNPYFNMIDRALTGPSAARDAETTQLLSSFLDRDDRNTSMGLPIRRDFTVDHRDDPAVKKCETVFKDKSTGKNLIVACDPLPIQERINSDFLWQRSPHQLAAFGAGTIESSGIDFALPYWMGRCYGVIPADDGQAGNTPCAEEQAPLAALTDDELSDFESPVLALNGIFDWLKFGWKLGGFAERYVKAQRLAPEAEKEGLTMLEREDLESPARLGTIGFLFKARKQLRALEAAAD